VRLFSIRPALTFRGRRFLGIRGWTGKPSHPPLTDFPIVCYVVAAGFDVVSFALDDAGLGRDLFRAATFVMVVGFVISIATAITGFWDWWRGMERDRSTGFLGRAKHTQVWRTANWHMTVMVTVTVLTLVDLLLRAADSEGRMAPSVLMLALSVLAAVLVALGATYGGAMVYEYQFNVEPLKGSTAWDETEVDQLPGGRTTSSGTDGT
jgi:uncharacterized membrane protein